MSTARLVAATALVVAGAVLSAAAGIAVVRHGEWPVGGWYLVGTVGLLAAGVAIALDRRWGLWTAAVIAVTLIVVAVVAEDPWSAAVVALAGAAAGTGPEPSGRKGAAVASWVALGLHALVGWLMALTGLLAPPVGVVLAAVIWVGGLGLLVRLRSRGWWSLPVPVGAMAAWVGLLTFGDLFLGWTA